MTDTAHDESEEATRISDAYRANALARKAVDEARAALAKAERAERLTWNRYIRLRMNHHRTAREKATR